jgi:hypothetical protein
MMEEEAVTDSDEMPQETEDETEELFAGGASAGGRRTGRKLLPTQPCGRSMNPS